MLRLLRTNADLRWLFVAQVVSFMGDWFSFVALAGLVKDATDSELLVSLAYVSFTLGMTFQVSDNSITSRRMRRSVLVQCLLSYLFGAVIIATSINVLAGLV